MERTGGEGRQRPVDGPSRGEPGERPERGGGETSQDRPGEGQGSVSDVPPGTARPDLDPEGTRDTNEGADDKARVVEPGTDDPSPRA